MNTKLKIGLVAAAVTLLAGVLLTEGVLIPKQIQGDVLAVRLVSLNSSDNRLHATFELRNDKGPKVDVWAATLTTTDRELDIDIKPVTLNKGDTATIQMDVPTEGKWQVRFRVNKHPKDEHRTGTLVYTDWIDSREEVANRI